MRRASWVTGPESRIVTPRLASARYAGAPSRSTATTDPSAPTSLIAARVSSAQASASALWVVEELPRVHRAHVGGAERGSMHRVGVLEQDRRPLLRHDGAADERAHRVDGHRARAGRVADVRLVRQQADLDVVCPHRVLEPRQPFDAEGVHIDARTRHDIGHDGWIARNGRVAPPIVGPWGSRSRGRLRGRGRQVVGDGRRPLRGLGPVRRPHRRGRRDPAPADVGACHGLAVRHRGADRGDRLRGPACDRPETTRDTSDAGRSSCSPSSPSPRSHR